MWEKMGMAKEKKIKNNKLYLVILNLFILFK